MESREAKPIKDLWEIKPDIKTGGLVLPGTRAPYAASGRGHVKNSAGGYQRFMP
jgi:hypothetical protein